MSIMRKAMVFLGLSDDEFDDYGRNNAQGAEQAQATRQTSMSDYSRGTSTIRPLARTEVPQSGTAVTRPTIIRPAEPRDVPAAVHTQSNPRVHVIEPIDFGDAQEVGDRLKEGRPVLLTLADVDPALGRRLIDFCSGTTYAIGGSMERAAKNVFLLIPHGVEVSAEEKQRLRERGLYKGK